MANVKSYTLTLDAQELHDLIEAALVCECQAAQIIGGLKRKGLDLDAQKFVTQNAPSVAARQADAGSEGGKSMRTNLAERLGYEPEEETRARQERLLEELRYREAMRRVAKTCCLWLGGAAFVFAVIAGYADMVNEAIVTGSIALGATAYGIL